jgi:hypothetical protein
LEPLFQQGRGLLFLANWNSLPFFGLKSAADLLSDIEISWLHKGQNSVYNLHKETIKLAVFGALRLEIGGFA